MKWKMVELRTDTYQSSWPTRNFTFEVWQSRFSERKSSPWDLPIFTNCK